MTSSKSRGSSSAFCTNAYLRQKRRTPLDKLACLDGTILQVLAATGADELIFRASMARHLTPTYEGIPHVLTIEAAGTYARARSTTIFLCTFRHSDSSCQ